MEALETMQERLTKMLPALDGIFVKERLDKFGLLPLEHHRLREDLIEMYKLMRHT